VTQRLLSTGLLAAVLALSACADLNPTTQRTMTGAAGGAAGGALIGAAAGGTGGFIWDRHVQSQERPFQQGVAAGRASTVQ
jgi:hypothetical protein